MFGPFIFIILIIWLSVLRWRRRKMIELSYKLSACNYTTLPIIGHAHIFLGSDEDRMKVFKKLGREALANDDGVTTIWQGQRLYIFTADAKIAEFLLKTCLEKDDTIKLLQSLTGNGSVFAPVKIWRPRRKVLASTFNPKNLVQFAEVFSRQSAIMVDQLHAAASKGAFSMWNSLFPYIIDSICESTLGVSVNSQKEREQPFLKMFEEISVLDSARFCQPWLHSDAVYKMTSAYQRHNTCKNIICKFVDQIIKAKRESMKEERDSITELDRNNKKDGLKTLLELLIDFSGGNQGYTDIELREETMSLVLGGTNTSVVGAAFVSVLLSRYPDEQEKVYQELHEVFGGSNRPIVAEDLPKLKYLDAFIRETLRLYPPAPIIVRKVDKEVTLPSGVTLVKDCGLVINIWALHRNPQYWGEDAEEFRPERFIDAPLRHPAAFMPFSHGPRACIGYRVALMSMKTAMASLLRCYRLLPPAEIHDLKKPLRVEVGFMMKDVDHFTIQIEPRRN